MERVGRHRVSVAQCWNNFWIKASQFSLCQIMVAQRFARVAACLLLRARNACIDLMI